MLLAERLLENLKGLLIEGERLVVPSLACVQSCQIVVAVSGVRMLLAERLLPDLERLLIEWERLVVPSLACVQESQIVVAGSRTYVIFSVLIDIYIQYSFAQYFRF